MLFRVLATLAFLAIPGFAFAQGAGQANVVGTCGTPNSTYSIGRNEPVTVDTTGSLCSAATVTATATATASATLPTVAPGAGASLYESLSGGLYVQPIQGTGIMSATNGGFENLLQGNAVLSATNGIYANLLQANAVLSSTNPIFAQITAGSAAIGTVGLAPQTSGGLLIASAIVANNTTSVAVKGSAGQLYGIDAYSISAATPVYIKLYNTAQGSVTCGSPTPVARYLVPATGATGSGQIWHDANGIAFSTAITYCVTAGIADNDTTSPAASTYIVDFLYK